MVTSPLTALVLDTDYAARKSYLQSYSSNYQSFVVCAPIIFYYCILLSHFHH